MSQSYRSDLTDEQWEVIQTLIPAAKTSSRPRTVDMRGVINKIFYILVARSAWCMLPHDFPKWKIVIITSDNGGLMAIGNELTIG